MPALVELDEPRAGYIVSRTELRWAARGTRYKGLFRPSIAIFLNEGYRLYDFTAGASHYDAVGIKLEQEKIAALMHDDVRSTKIDFLTM